MRHFINQMPDLVPGSRVHVDQAHFKGLAKSLLKAIVEGMPPTFDNCDGGLYVGCVGVAYMFHYLAKSEIFADMREELLTRARNYTEVSLSYCAGTRNRDPPAAFLLGSAGVYATGSLVYGALQQKSTVDELNKKYLALGSTCQPVDFLDCGSDELFVGRAGYLCGAMALNQQYPGVISKEVLNAVCKSVVKSGRLYSQRHKSPSPLMYAYYRTEYLGPAHGLCSILQMLLHNPDYLHSDKDAERDVHAAVDFMLQLQQPSGNIAPALDEVKHPRPASEELVHWCHGGPGIIYLFAKAFLVWKDPKYLQACIKIGELAWQRGLLKKGPGICHGVAGSGYVFLLLYRLTSDERHLHRALKFAEFMFTEEFQKGARTPDTPYSLYEGLAGTACFLADLMQPQVAAFPFSDVFKD